MNFIDRTNEPLPLKITWENAMSYQSTFIVDNNLSRPAIVVNSNNKVSIMGLYRQQNKQHINPNNKQLNFWFDDSFLPKLDKLEFSNHDFVSANIVSLGLVKLQVGSAYGNTQLLSIPFDNGTKGEGSTVEFMRMEGHRFGIMVSGQTVMNISIDKTIAQLWEDDGVQPAGHTIYFNESKSNGKFNRSFDIVCSIKDSSALGSSTQDHVTAKFKGVDGIRYSCLKDTNSCGALDQFSSSGWTQLNWKGDKADKYNKVFQALRSGQQDDKFGKADGNFILQGLLDCSNLPTNIPSIRLETAQMFTSKLRVKGGGKPEIYSIVPNSGIQFVGADIV